VGDRRLSPLCLSRYSRYDRCRERIERLFSDGAAAPREEGRKFLSEDQLSRLLPADPASIGRIEALAFRRVGLHLAAIWPRSQKPAEPST